MSMERTMVRVSHPKVSIFRRYGMAALLGGYMLGVGIAVGVEWVDEVQKRVRSGVGRLLHAAKARLARRRLVKEAEIHLRHTR